MSFVERSIILCPYFGGSTIGGSIYNNAIIALFRSVDLDCTLWFRPRHIYNSSTDFQVFKSFSEILFDDGEGDAFRL